MPTIRQYLESIRDRHTGASDDNRLYSIDRELWSEADAIAALAILDSAEADKWGDTIVIHDPERATN